MQVLEIPETTVTIAIPFKISKTERVILHRKEIKNDLDKIFSIFLLMWHFLIIYEIERNFCLMIAYMILFKYIYPMLLQL